MSYNAAEGSKTASNGLDPHPRRVTFAGVRERLRVPYGRLKRTASGIVATTRRLTGQGRTIYRRLSASRFARECPRTTANAIDPLTGRVIPASGRIAAESILGASNGMLARRAYPAVLPAAVRMRPAAVVDGARAPDSGILDRSSISSDARSLQRSIIAVADHCSRQRLQPPMISLTDQASAGRSTLRIEPHFPPRARACARAYSHKGTREFP